MMTKENTRHYFYLTAIVALAAALRLHDLGLRSLWLDEAFSAWFSSRDWHYLWHDVPQFETHPPLYYSLLKLWRVFGSDEFTLRLLSTVVNLLTLPVVYVAGRICGGKRVGLLAAFLFATAKLEIFYAQDARPYTCFTLAMAITVAAGCWLVRHPGRARLPLRALGRDPYALFAYGSLAVGLALLQWFQNVGVLFIVPGGLFLIAWWAKRHRGDRDLFVNLALTALLAMLIYAPFITNFVNQATAFQTGFWLQAPPATYLITQTLHLFGQTFDGGGAPVRVFVFIATIVPVTALGLYFLIRQRDETRRDVALFLLSASAGAWLFNIVLTYTLQPVFMERTLLPLQAPWFVLLALLPFALPEKTQRPAVLVLCAMFMAGALEYEAMPDAAPNTVQRPWKTIVQDIAAQGPDFPVIAVPNHAAMAMEYYERQLNVHFNVHPLPAAFPAIGSDYSYPIGGRGVPAITPQSVAEALNATEHEEKIWLVTHGAVLDSAEAPDTSYDNAIAAALAHRYRPEKIYQDRGATLLLYTRR